MKTYDVVVVGSGSGGEIVEAAVSHGMNVAWVDKGPLGGTCLNVGCIPSKILIHPADRIMEIQEAKKLGITVEIKDIDFQGIMERVQQPIQESRASMEKGIEHTENVDYYKGQGHFIKDYTLEILGKEIKGEKIFLGSGARPLIPPIRGLDSIPYLTNETVFYLKEKPESMAIIGGGYIAMEFAHFFSAVGTAVTIFQRGDRLIPNSEPEISELLKNQLMKRMRIYLNTEVTEVQNQGNKAVVTGKDSLSGKEITMTAENVFVAAGRQSNADLLKVENTGVQTDPRGYIKVNEYLETSKKDIWALGDAIGKAMFKHVANEEASVAWGNAFHDKKTTMDYHAIPYAVFTYPEIAAVGMTQEEAKKHHEILVGSARYSDVAKGQAMMEYDGFTKAIVDKQTGKILGFHIIGPYAPMLIQEVINGMALGGNISFISHGLHIHPALPELILRTLGNLSEPR
ncbi:MAG TPA: dihydrolipoyl dehydrogenase [Thermoplasmata archaeon]|jgi:mycothione reductase|nr:MAG TPA: dihydrolipoyl dehydrogenase [Thermoplasmata archaeon]